MATTKKGGNRAPNSLEYLARYCRDYGAQIRNAVLSRMDASTLQEALSAQELNSLHSRLLDGHHNLVRKHIKQMAKTKVPSVTRQKRQNQKRFRD